MRLRNADGGPQLPSPQVGAAQLHNTGAFSPCYYMAQFVSKQKTSCFFFFFIAVLPLLPAPPQHGRPAPQRSRASTARAPPVRLFAGVPSERPQREQRLRLVLRPATTITTTITNSTTNLIH